MAPPRSHPENRTSGKRSSVKQQAFPFKALPAEIRNMIYRLAMLPSNYLFLCISKKYWSYPYTCAGLPRLKRTGKLLLNLRATSKQICEEASPFLFTEAELRIPYDDPFFKLLTRATFGLRQRSNPQVPCDTEHFLKWFTRFHNITIQMSCTRMPR